MLEMSQVRAKVAVRISLQEMRDRRLKRAEHRRADEERNLHRLVVAPEPDRETRRVIAPGAVREGGVRAWLAISAEQASRHKPEPQPSQLRCGGSLPSRPFRRLAATNWSFSIRPESMKSPWHFGIYRRRSVQELPRQQHCYASAPSHWRYCRVSSGPVKTDRHGHYGADRYSLEQAFERFAFENWRDLHDSSSCRVFQSSRPRKIRLCLCGV